MELEAELERELQQQAPITTTTAVIQDDLLQDQDYKIIPGELDQPTATTTVVEEEDVKLVADELSDRFEALPRPNRIFLHGVDDMSTENITSWCNQPNVEKVEWINDSACNLVFATEEEATTALATFLPEGSTTTVDQVTHRELVPAKPYIDATNNKTHHLFVRISTDEDIKVRGARNHSRYYLIHGVRDGDKHLSEERQEARKAHRERMTKSGGDGRSVFSRLGNKVERRRSVSPSRQQERSIKRESVREEKEIPQHLKSRLGPLANSGNDDRKVEAKEE